MTTTTISRPAYGIRVRRLLGVASVIALAIATWLALFWSPRDAAMGEVVRILYVHVPNAWLAYLSFVVVFLASVGYLWTKRPLLDAIAVSSAEIGVLFTGLTLVLGSIWARPTWGVWWTWEPRLITTAVMFVMYVGYLLVRSLSTDLERRATRAAVLGIVLVVDVPIVHLSVTWMNALHQLPSVLRPDLSPTLDRSMLTALVVMVAAFTILYAYVMTARVELELARQARALAARQ
ncbi:MAG TPA: cytochrome c biogenesis protein CcsA [Candidatus Limnocylindria bacterium]|nr:cytochrome c biogenesis protein CcsA [Candidatus Limnocylindria bacterium]